MAQQMRMHDFDRPSLIVSDRRKRKHAQAAPRGGFFHSGLTVELQESLVEYARLTAASARADGRLALAAQNEERLSRREERTITMLNKAVDQYAYSMELFDAWAKEGGQRARSKADVAKALLNSTGRSKPEAQQLEYLRTQIEMRVLGLGWTQYATRWSSSADSRIGTVAHLQELLEEIICEEIVLRGRRQLPTEAAPPQSAWRDSAQLGTLDADALEVRMQAQFSTEELQARAEAARQRRIEAGISDPVEAMQGPAPDFDQQLIGKRIEV